MFRFKSDLSANASLHLGGLTGGKDKDLVKLFDENDIKLGSAVSKNTFMLIAKSLDEESTKITKAKELDIPIHSLDEFKKSLGL